MKKFTKITSPQFISVCLLAAIGLVRAQENPLLPETAPTVWLEAESAVNIPDFADMTTYGKEDLISGRILQITYDKKNSDQRPDEVRLDYHFEAPEAGSYDAWARVVFSNIRAPFEWRVNGGEWQQNNETDHPITNIQELSFWNPIGWSPMGEVALKAGENTFEIRLKKSDADKNKNLRFLADTFVFRKGGFQPNFKYAPGDEAWLDDTARKAAEQVFVLPEPADDARVEMALDGAWQYAPFDERIIMAATRTDGLETYPDLSQASWYGLEVPTNRNWKFSDHKWSHRYLLRTMLEVPESFDGGSYFLRFETLSLINTLFINGKKVGDFDVHYGQWQVDISQYLNAGAVNEILLVVKDGWYALSGENENGIAENVGYFPWSMWNRNQGVTMKLEWPIKGSDQTGILDSVYLVATEGEVYVDDVFVKPFPVTREEIEVDVTLRNSGDSEAAAMVEVSLQPEEGAATALPSQTRKQMVPARSTTTFTLKFSSEDIPLWWPEEPTLYQAVTKVTVDDEASDQLVTRFGNREWESRNNQFYLNGIRQHLRANLLHYSAPGDADTDEILKDWKEAGINTFRRRFQFPYAGMSPREVLEWADEKGVNVRFNAGTFDGQHASYRLAYTEGEGKDRVKKGNEPLYTNWRAQILNHVKARRNHPSVQIWELDNEIVYINGRNFGNLDIVSPEFTKTSDAVMEADPTRKTMTGGGAAGMDKGLPVYGIHYFETEDRDYPDEAYTLEKSLARYGTGEDGKVWPVDFDDRPMFMSETAFLHGRNASQFAAMVGEKAFLGKARNKDAFTLLHEMYGTGYRWAEVGATHFWTHDGVLTDEHDYHYWQPIAPLMREWDRSFGPGQKVTRTFKLFNDTRNTAPITVSWMLKDGGGEILSKGSDTHNVAPGTSKQYQVAFTTPEVDEATAATFAVTASQNGEEVYSHSYDYRILPTSSLNADVINKRRLAVWDPAGSVRKRLNDQGVQYLTLEGAADLEKDYDMLIVGPDALAQDLATDNRWMQMVAEGRRLLVLEQANPLHYQATPANAEPAGHTGRMSFSQNLEHPVFTGLEQHDLSFWNSDHVVYRNIYTKPTKGALSLAHADDKLGYSAAIWVPLEDSGMLLSQYAIGGKLNDNIVAQTLFDNMVEYVAAYEPVVRKTAVVAKEDGPLIEIFGDLGLEYTQATDVMEAISSHPGGIVVVDATPGNMQTLADNMTEVEEFWKSGGWLMMMGVTPDSLESFNKVVGYDHLIREFAMERTMFPVVRDPLTAGLTLRDVVMGSGKRIQRQTRDEWPADDAFDYILDTDNIAPFSEFPSPAHFNDPDTKGPGSDTWPRNMVNGFSGQDHWRLGFTIHVHKGDPTQFTLELPREETITGFMVDPADIFNGITEIQLTFDGNEKDVEVLKLSGTNEEESFTFEPREATKVTINVTEWKQTRERNLIGLDNLKIEVQRPENFEERVRPMLNIGGLIKYPRGEGGVVVNQYRIAGSESNPLNRVKKETVTGTILRNLGAPFSGSGAVIAGSNLEYTPISMEEVANLYLQKDQGFPRNPDLSSLPLGKQTFEDVDFLIRDFSTSPLESAVTLKHPRLKSNAESDSVEITVDRKADALFFLHSHIWQGREWTPNRRNPEPPVVFQYRVTYDDGSETVIPIQITRSVEDYAKPSPQALPEAALAWQDIDEKDSRAVYTFQWNNPNSDKTIKSVTLEYGEEGNKKGIPVLFALTAADNL